MSGDDVLLTDRDGAVATVTLNRPRVRNALDHRLRTELRSTMMALDEDPDVAAVVLTGADPAFCAGLDLVELAEGAPADRSGRTEGDAALDRVVSENRGPFPTMSIPVIGAVNGAAITGGFEIALACDFLIASEHARFADTHARIGIMPGWGLTVALPEAIGYRRALEMSTTGNFIDADTALTWGLVNHVVAHESLMSTSLRLAHEIAENDPLGVAEIRSIYHDGARMTRADAWNLELERSSAWLAGRDGSDLAERRARVIERGRSQVTHRPAD